MVRLLWLPRIARNIDAIPVCRTGRQTGYTPIWGRVRRPALKVAARSASDALLPPGIMEPPYAPRTPPRMSVSEHPPNWSMNMPPARRVTARATTFIAFLLARILQYDSWRRVRHTTEPQVRSSPRPVIASFRQKGTRQRIDESAFISWFGFAKNRTGVSGFPRAWSSVLAFERPFGLTPAVGGSRMPGKHHRGKIEPEMDRVRG